MAVTIKHVSNPTLAFDLSGSGMSQNADYAVGIANEIQTGYKRLTDAMTGVSDTFMGKLNATATYYSDLAVLDEVIEDVMLSDDSIFVTEYTIENYMDIPVELQELVIHDPIIRQEYEDGEIVGFNYNYNGSVEYDNTVNELLYSGMSDGDVAHDIVLGEDRYYTSKEIDTIEKTRSNYIKAILEDGEDLTDID